MGETAIITGVVLSVDGGAVETYSRQNRIAYIHCPAPDGTSELTR